MVFRQKRNPPANEADFERLCLKLLKAHWKCPTLELYGRRGERQHGIDILDMSGLDPLRAGQCKLYNSRKSLPPALIRDEVDAVKAFKPPIGLYALMTTAKISTATQNAIIEINRIHRETGLFLVELFAWDRIDDLLDEFPALRDEEYRTLAGEAVSQIKEELAQITVQVSSLKLNASSGESDKSDALHLEIDEARSLVQKGESQAARFLLQRMRTHDWDRMGPRHKFRVLANIGAAFLHERELDKAAQFFTEAASFQPEDVQAQENQALAYLISLPTDQAFSQISLLQTKFPNSSRIASFWIATAPSSWTAQEIEAKLPVSQQSAPEPLAALAIRALSESQFSRCESLVSRSLQGRPDWSYPQLIKGRCLAFQFLDPSSDSSAHSRNEQMRTAENLITSALDAAIKEQDLAMQVDCLLERSYIRLLLGEREKADEDVRKASDLVPKDHAVRRSVADMKLRHGQADDAIRDLRKLFTDEGQVDIALRLAFALHARKASNDLEEATRLFLTVIDYAGPVPSGGREYVASVLLQLLLQENRWVDAESVCDILAARDSSAAMIAAFRARIMLLKGNMPDASALANDAVAQLSLSAPAEEIRWIARLLYDLRRYAEALPLLQKIAQVDVLSDDTKAFLNCAMRLGRDDLVMETSAALRKNGVVDPEWILYEVQTLEQYDIDAAIQVLNAYLEKNPGDKHIRLRRSLIGMTWNRPEIMDANPQFMPPVGEVDARAGRIAVQVMKIGGYPDEALVYAYRLLRSRFSEPDAHLAFMFNLHPIEPRPTIPEFSEAGIGAAVLFAEEGEEHGSWVIIEDEIDADSSRLEYRPNHPIAQALIGHKVGERIVLAKGSISERAATIKAILNKYVYRYQDCLRNWQFRFPETRQIESVKVMHVSKEGKEQVDLSAMLRSVDQLTVQTERLKEAYRTEIVPLSMIAAFRGKTTVETTLYFAQEQDTQVLCCLGTEEERGQAFKALDVSNVWVIEPSAVATILLLNLQDTLRSIPVRLLITQGTLAELNEMLRQESLFRGDGGVLTRIEHRTAYIPITQAERARRLEVLQSIIEKLKSLATVVSCVELAGLDSQQRETTIKVFGQGGAESVIVSSRPGHLLWTDDHRLAAAARNDFGVMSAWTQCITQWCATKGFVAAENFADISAKLIGYGYYFTSPTPASLVAAAKLGDWNPTAWSLSAALEQLGTKSIDPRAAAVLAVSFLERTYREAILEERRRMIVQQLLGKLAKRGEGIAIIKAIKKAISTVFGLNVVGAADAESTIEAWLKARELLGDV
jgi:tetratricopeptide (TPR) repeat protein